MSNRAVRLTLCLGCSLLVASQSMAATIEPGQGNASINQGQGFQPVNNRIDANVGDTVMVGPNGFATVVYDDGCTVNVQPGAITTVAPLSPCASGSYAQGQPYSFDWPAWLLAGATAGLFAWGIYEIAKRPSSNTTNPVSP